MPHTGSTNGETGRLPTHNRDTVGQYGIICFVYRDACLRALSNTIYGAVLAMDKNSVISHAEQWPVSANS